MALIKCPDCGKEVSNMAAVCIHCGCPLKEESHDIDFSILDKSVEDCVSEMLVKQNYAKYGWTPFLY